MLSRTADSLYWLCRYVERAENMARALQVGDRMALMPDIEGRDPAAEWRSAVVISGTENLYEQTYQDFDAKKVIRFMARDENNPSSIFFCIKSARENARAVRNAITSEMWECLNSTWLEFDQHWSEYEGGGDLLHFLDWVKSRSQYFLGAKMGTMFRDDAYAFARMGTYIERADNTARILDVKYHVLLPEDEEVGGSVDYLQWTTILRATEALGNYHWLYNETPQPLKIVELLILRERMPRSLLGCVSAVNEFMEKLAEIYSARTEAHRLVGNLYSDLRFANAEDIFQSGLHEYLVDFIRRNNNLGEEITRQYLFHG